jgi:ABC-type lipoprotein release transport system permease subunit
MLFTISWRNVWRNKLRSGIIIVAVALGLTASIFMTSLYKGLANQRIEKAIRTEVSHIQIHQSEFRENNDITKFIPGALDMTSQIRSMETVSGAASRLVIYSMVASAETSAGIKISGIIPEQEMEVTNLQEKIVEGTYLTEKKKNPVLISRKLAEKLNVKMGSKVVITLQDLQNNIVSGAFRIVGLFDTHSKAYDESNIFVLYSDLSALMMVPPGAAHEIAIRVLRHDQVEGLYTDLESLYKELEVLTWSELSPELWFLTEAMDFLMYVLFIIILLALLFGLVNTMLMVVLERTKEIGMLMAVGMNRVRIFSMIVLETVFLALTGGITGVFAGMLISKYFETHAIDLSRMGRAFEDLGFDSYVYTSMNVPLLINVTLLVILAGILGSLFPAYRALQNNPSEALRIE